MISKEKIRIIFEYQIWSRLPSIQDRGRSVGTARAVQDSKPGGSKGFSLPHIFPDRHCSPSRLLYMGT